MGREGLAPGAAGLHLVDGLSLLRPEEQVFDAMLSGWRNQQLARNLAFSTIGGREKAVRAFARHADAFPWRWTASQVDEWLGDLRAVRNLKRSTLRNYQEAVHAFCAYLVDPAYRWSVQCEQRFGTHPVQVVHEWNTAVHVADAEADAGKRAFTRKELIALFDHADEQVARIRAAGRKGWLPAFRDAALLKTAYAFGLRRNEIRMLDVVDFGRNPDGPEFGECGVVYVRHGKAKKGSPPKRRSVLAVWDWSAEVLQEWVEDIRPLFATVGSLACWPSERGPKIGLSAINTRLAAYQHDVDLRLRVLGLPHPHLAPGPGRHCRRRAEAEQEGPMTRQVSYKWRLREVMAAAGMFAATELEPHLRDRGITLSSVQVWRLVTGTPERLSLPVLAALCDIFACTPAELIATKAENAAPRKAAGGETNVVDLNTTIRPRRARIRPEG